MHASLKVSKFGVQMAQRNSQFDFFTLKFTRFLRRVCHGSSKTPEEH